VKFNVAKKRKSDAGERLRHEHRLRPIDSHALPLCKPHSNPLGLFSNLLRRYKTPRKRINNLSNASVKKLRWWITRIRL
jgi:hypothetical protein